MSSHELRAGDRVRAARRPGFPTGTILQLMDSGFVLVQWDGHVLETAHHAELARIENEDDRR